MQAGVIAGEFRRIYAAAHEEPVLVRGQRSGRVDARRAFRVASGDGRVFAQRAVERTAEPRGTLALIVQPFDFLLGTQAHPNGRAAYAGLIGTLRALSQGAEQVGIRTRFFAYSNGRAGDGVRPGRHVFSRFGEMMRYPLAANEWPDIAGGIAAAQRWHDDEARCAGRGRRLTLVCTCSDPVPNCRVNRDHDEFVAWMTQSAAETARIGKTTDLYLLGITPDLAAGSRWGQAVQHGLARTFADSYPAAARYVLPAIEQVPGAVRDIARKMARRP